MLPMADRGGRRRADAAGSTRGAVLALALLLAGAAVAALAWFVLVRAAIDFGGEARDGESLAWLFLAAAALGAIACLALALVLASRAAAELGVTGRRGKRPTGHRH